MLSDDFKKKIASQVAIALLEDAGSGDLSADLVPSKPVEAKVISREACTLCGQPWFDEVFAQVNDSIEVIWLVKEGQKVAENTELCLVKGLSAPLLTAERTALNFLQTLSGTATVVSQYVEAVQGTSAQIVDTRKTIPGLRLAQKYAVRTAGGTNHRLGLYDGILIKENHIIAAGSIRDALKQAYQVTRPDTLIQIEVETLDELEEALNAGAKLILLDNFSLNQLHEAVQQTKRRAILEASGNVTLENVRKIAQTGVNRISVGSLTKHVRAIDLSMRFLDKAGT